LPREYSRCVDPFVALGAAAGATTHLKLGTGVCLVVERDPITLAKEVATVDHISGGRFLFGIGAGWNKEEMANHGTEPATRWKLLRERVEAMIAIWTMDEAEYHGQMVDFESLWSWPKPVQRPHPPVIVGGAAERALQAAADYGGGWAPIAGRPDDLAGRIRQLQDRAAERGRPPLEVTVFAAPTDPRGLAELAELGVSRAVLSLPSASEDEVLRTLDTYVTLVANLA
jgi:probable F420-dependent oxidoreductase